jgi:outer membrane protein insertion porin family
VKRVLLVWAALLAASPLAAQRPEVAELRFEGARSFSTMELRAAIITEATRCPNLLYLAVCWAGIGLEPAYLDPAALDADVLRLRVYYHERGFRNAIIRADTAHVGRGVRVTFRIEEGRPLRVGELTLLAVPEDVPMRPLPLRVGDTFDIVAYEAGRDTLQARLRNSGYARAQVLIGYEIGGADPHTARVWYEVVPGEVVRFGEVRVVGTAATSPELVRRMLTFREGERYNRSALLESQRNLYRLQLFRHAEVQADVESDAGGDVPVLVQVAEGHLRRVRLGAGLNNMECANLDGRWVNRNFAGEGRRFEVRSQVGNLLVDQCQQVPVLMTDYTPYRELTGLMSVDFTQPWFFGVRNSIGVGLFAERRSVPEVFVRTAVGGHLTVGRSLGGSTGLALSYRPEWTRLGAQGDLFFCVSFVACAIEDMRVLREPHWLSPVALTLSADRSNDPFTPSSGFIARLDLEHAGGYTGSDFAYTRLIGEGSRYVGERDGVVLATRLRGGMAWPHGGPEGAVAVRLNPQKRFFAGGANSVRGFDQYRLGPVVLGIDAVPWLVESEEGAGCGVAAINDGRCDAGALADNRFYMRPVGGEVLLEGNLELRFPLPAGRGKLRGAAFVDAGQVWATAADVALGEIMATPGVGIRYYSPVGPIRIDAGFNTQGRRTLNVLTTRVEECLYTGSGDCRKIDGPPRQTLRNTDDVVALDRPVTYGRALSDIDSASDLFRRFRLHFSIGQAF